MEEWTLWILIIAVSLLLSIGNILWKVASDRIGKVSWSALFNIQWDLQTFFTPLVLVALFIMFVGRFTSIVPAGYMNITQLITAMTILSLVFTAILDTIFLNARYPWNVWIGIIIGFIAIYLIGANVEV
jgi:drug/metabolite transporter (DMT)-like permease